MTHLLARMNEKVWTIHLIVYTQDIAYLKNHLTIWSILIAMERIATEFRKKMNY